MTVRLLDTNVCAAVIRGHDLVTRRFVSALTDDVLYVSSITVFELIYGASRCGREAVETAKVEAFLQGGPKSVPVDDRDAHAAGRLRAELATRGEMIGAFDLLIAGQALARDWVLVTANTREFERVRELQLENWALPG